MKEVLAEAGVPTARFGVFDDPVGARRVPADPARPVGGQDRRAGRRQGRAGDRLARRGRGRRRRQALRATPSARPADGSSSKRGWSGPECSLLVLCDGTRAGPAGPGPGLQAPAATATAAPTPAGWARTRRCPRWTTPLVASLVAGAVAPLVAALRGPGHRLPGRALRRAHADPVRPPGPQPIPWRRPTAIITNICWFQSPPYHYGPFLIQCFFFSVFFNIEGIFISIHFKSASTANTRFSFKVIGIFDNRQTLIQSTNDQSLS